jgi:hypothetical protein
MKAVAQKLGIGTTETLRKWVRQDQIDAGARPGTTSEESAEPKRLKKENAVELATAEWVCWYCHRRPHGEIGHVPPVEYEINHHRANHKTPGHNQHLRSLPNSERFTLHVDEASGGYVRESRRRFDVGWGVARSCGPSMYARRGVTPRSRPTAQPVTWWATASIRRGIL